MESSYTAEVIAELKQAYLTLGVPLDSSALTIKRAYWHLAKKWHPDRWATDLSSQQATTARMSELNNAYSRIQHAPLRYHIESFSKRRQPDTTISETRQHRDAMPVTDHLETIVRFTCGFAFGLSLILKAMPFEMPWLLIGLILPITCGYCAIRFGDRFWHWILEKAWLFW